MQNVEGDAQNVPIVTAHEVLERFAVSRLRALDQGALVLRGKAPP
jgi:hypothetical protein